MWVKLPYGIPLCVGFPAVPVGTCWYPENLNLAPEIENSGNSAGRETWGEL